MGLSEFICAFLINITTGCLNEHALRDFINQLKKGRKPVNHDLQKALKHSFLLALQNIVLDCHEQLSKDVVQEFTLYVGNKSWTAQPFKNLSAIFKNIASVTGMNRCSGQIKILPIYPPEYRDELEWLDQRRNQLADELKKVRKEPLDENFFRFDEIETFLIPEGVSATQRIQSVKEKLICNTLTEPVASECYEKWVREEIFERTCAHFMWEIKYNQVVFNIFVAHSVVQISSKLSELLQQVNSSEASAEIVLEVGLKELSSPHLEEAVKNLQILGKDVTLKIRGVEAGSSVLLINGSSDGLKRIESLFKSGGLTEVSGIPVKDIRLSFPVMSAQVKRTNLSQWLLKKFDDAIESGWQAIEDSVSAVKLAPAFRQYQGVRLVKQIPVSDEQTVILEAGLKPSENQEVSVCFRVYPVAGQKFLPENLTFALLSDSGKILKDAKVEGSKDIIIQELKGLPGEQFDIRIALGDISITEHFVI